MTGATEVRAAVLAEFGRPLAHGSRERPRPAAGETLIRVRAVGLCGTDLKLRAGELGPRVSLPLVPGHEIAGEVVEGDTPLAAGTRVAAYIYCSCGSCGLCRGGHPTLCADAVRLGIERDGGLSTYAVLPSANLLEFSDRVPFEYAAVAMDAVAAPWAALHRAGEVAAGERVLIVGVGGLGLHAVQIARAGGASVAVLDPVEERRRRALELGSELAVGPGELEAVGAWSDGGVDLVVELSGAPAGFAAAVDAAAAGGRIVVCGYSVKSRYPLDSAQVVLKELVIRGSRNASVEEARAALAAVDRGDVVPEIGERLPLDQVEEGFAHLAAASVPGRIVIEP